MICFKDWKSWAFAFMNGCATLSLSSLGNFFPTFIKEFGYTAANAQLFSVIPYAVACVTLLSLATISDRLNRKGPFVILSLSVACIGYIILLTASATSVKTVGACFLAAGIYPAVVLKLNWLAINTGGFTKRGTTWALAEVVGQCLGIMGNNIYDTPPRFIKGHAIILSFLLAAIVVATGLLLWMSRENKKRDRILADFAQRGEVHPHIGRSLEEEFDRHINFRYIL